MQQTGKTKAKDRKMKPTIIRIILLLLMAVISPAAANAQEGMTDKDKLSVALDYFAGGKYREALNLLVKLDRKYSLNPRFKAYIGVCYYYEWEYESACKYLDPQLEKLEIYAPHERSVYYYSAAESHFQLQQYAKAIPLYEKLLNVCYNKEKGDAFFRLGFCYLQQEDWQNSLDSLSSALNYYETFGYPDNKQARVVQIKKMIDGCKKEIEKLAANEK